MIVAMNNKIKKSFIIFISLMCILLGMSISEMYDIQTVARPPQTWISNHRISVGRNLEKAWSELVIYNTTFDIRSTNNSTHSMYPLIGDETKVILMDATPEDIEKLMVGDVISYTTDGVNRILHRIVSIDNNKGIKEFRMKGDDNWFRDTFIVRPENIKQILVGVIY